MGSPCPKTWVKFNNNSRLPHRLFDIMALLLPVRAALAECEGTDFKPVNIPANTPADITADMAETQRVAAFLGGTSRQ